MKRAAGKFTRIAGRMRIDTVAGAGGKQLENSDLVAESSVAAKPPIDTKINKIKKEKTKNTSSGDKKKMPAENQHKKTEVVDNKKHTAASRLSEGAKTGDVGSDGVPDGKESVFEVEMDRREFLRYMAKGLLVLSGIFVGASLIRLVKFFFSEGEEIQTGSGVVRDSEGYLKAGGRYITESEITEKGSRFIYENNGQRFPAMVFKFRGSLRASSVRCTHDGCTVILEGDRWVCPCHQAIFEVESGDVLSGPAKEPLPVLTVVVETDGKVKVL
ncbi:MAG: Rieske (2Fe-2S) protein [Thermoplasmata archaeon]